MPQASSSGALHLLQHAQRLAEVRMEVASHQVENLDDQRIAHRIEDLVPGFAVHDNLLGPQDSEMLGNICLLHSELFNERARGNLSITELFHNGNARGVGESLKKFSFEAAQSVWHRLRKY